MVQARTRVSDVLIRGGVALRVVGDVVLIVAELVANAVEHGRGRWVDVELSIDDSAIEIVVSNQGAVDLGDPAGWTMPPAHARAGRGLPLVRALVDDVKWAASQGRLSVRARRSVR